MNHDTFDTPGAPLVVRLLLIAVAIAAGCGLGGFALHRWLLGHQVRRLVAILSHLELENLPTAELEARVGGHRFPDDLLTVEKLGLVLHEDDSWHLTVHGVNTLERDSMREVLTNG